VVSYTGLATQVKRVTITKENGEESINFILVENYTELAEIIIAASKLNWIV